MIVLVITVIAGFAFYNLAPPEIEPGLYTITLEIHSDSIDFFQTYNFTFGNELSDDEFEHFIVGISTNVTITVPESVAITPDNPLRIILDATGNRLSANDIVATLTNDAGFNLTLRPNRQSGQTFII